MPRCLIVDDHSDGREGFQEYLGTFGIRAEVAATAEDALRLVHAEAFDLLIVDLQLPGMDGWEFIRAIRSGRRLGGIPIIAVSACVFPDDRARATAAGCDVFLAKPCPPDDLLVTIRRLLGMAASGASQ